MNLMKLPDPFFPSEFGISYRTFWIASRKMLLNFSSWLNLYQIGHLHNLRSLYYKIFEFNSFRRRLLIDVEIQAIAVMSLRM